MKKSGNNCGGFQRFLASSSLTEHTVSNFVTLILKLHNRYCHKLYNVFFFLRNGCCSQWLCRQQTKIVHSTPSKYMDIERKLSNGKVFKWVSLHVIWWLNPNWIHINLSSSDSFHSLYHFINSAIVTLKSDIVTFYR